MSEKVLVTPAELAAMPPATTVIIDTRNPDAFAAGHIPGAVNVHDIFTHLAMSTPDAISELREKFAASFGAAGLSGAETAVCYEESMNSGFGQSCRGYFLLKFMGYPEARVLRAPVDGGGEVSALVSSDRVFVSTSDMEQAAADSDYQLWVIDADGISSAGLMRPEDGSSTALVEAGAGATVAVTIEPRGGSEQPTTDPIVAVEI